MECWLIFGLTALAAKTTVFATMASRWREIPNFGVKSQNLARDHKTITPRIIPSSELGADS
jgi:hypothetical protein